jgi:hypothetical protein
MNFFDEIFLNARFQFPRLLSKLERPYPAYQFLILSLPSLPPVIVRDLGVGNKSNLMALLPYSFALINHFSDVMGDVIEAQSSKLKAQS